MLQYCTRSTSRSSLRTSESEISRIEGCLRSRQTSDGTDLAAVDKAGRPLHWKNIKGNETAERSCLPQSHTPRTRFSVRAASECREPIGWASALLSSRGCVMPRRSVNSLTLRTVHQELLARNEYLAAENRVLKAQMKGRG